MQPKSAINETTRDSWTDACRATAFVALLLISVHVLAPLVVGATIPYAGGGAVILGIGAVLASAIRTRTNRLLAAGALLGLMVFRPTSALLPGIFISSHGPVTHVDGVALALLIVVAACMLMVAMRYPSSGSNPPMPAHASAG